MQAKAVPGLELPGSFKGISGWKLPVLVFERPRRAVYQGQLPLLPGLELLSKKYRPFQGQPLLVWGLCTFERLEGNPHASR